MTLKIVPLSTIGAEVSGLDLSQAIGDLVAQRLKEAWYEHGVLIFKRAAHSHAEQLRLSRVFGEPEPHPFEDLQVKDAPGLVQVSGEGRHKGPGFIVSGRLLVGWLFWHQDQSCTANIPQGSLLRMVRVTETQGETGFLNVARAYEDLSQETKLKIENLEARHHLTGGRAEDIEFGLEGVDVRSANSSEWPFQQVHLPEMSDVVHRLVITHPCSGRKTLLLSPLSIKSIEGLSEDESRTLLAELTRHVLQKKYMYFHRWEEHDMVLWDNWVSMHCGCGYPPDQHRLGYRAQFNGPAHFKTGRIASRTG